MAKKVAVTFRNDVFRRLTDIATSSGVTLNELVAGYVKKALVRIPQSSPEKNRMWRRKDRVEQNASTAKRVKELGNIGEQLAVEFLESAGFSALQDLNKTEVMNYPFADIYAERNGEKLFVSVKSRNKLTCDGKLNPSYKISPKQRSAANKLELNKGATAAWVAVIFDVGRNVYSCYFGKLKDLKWKHGIRVTPDALADYECLAKDRIVPPAYDISRLKNVAQRRRSPNAMSRFGEMPRLRTAYSQAASASW